MDKTYDQHEKVSDIPEFVHEAYEIENDEIKKAFEKQTEALQRERINREEMLKNLDNLTNEELIRLGRSSYLKHINRFNVQ